MKESGPGNEALAASARRWCAALHDVVFGKPCTRVLAGDAVARVPPSHRERLLLLVEPEGRAAVASVLRPGAEEADDPALDDALLASEVATGVVDRLGVPLRILPVEGPIGAVPDAVHALARGATGFVALHASREWLLATSPPRPAAGTAVRLRIPLPADVVSDGGLLALDADVPLRVDAEIDGAWAEATLCVDALRCTLGDLRVARSTARDFCFEVTGQVGRGDETETIELALAARGELRVKGRASGEGVWVSDGTRVGLRITREAADRRSADIDPGSPGAPEHTESLSLSDLERATVEGTRTGVEVPGTPSAADRRAPPLDETATLSGVVEAPVAAPGHGASQTAADLEDTRTLDRANGQAGSADVDDAVTIDTHRPEHPAAGVDVDDAVTTATYRPEYAAAAADVDDVGTTSVDRAEPGTEASDFDETATVALDRTLLSEAVAGTASGGESPPSPKGGPVDPDHHQ